MICLRKPCVFGFLSQELVLLGLFGRKNFASWMVPNIAAPDEAIAVNLVLWSTNVLDQMSNVLHQKVFCALKFPILPPLGKSTHAKFV